MIENFKHNRITLQEMVAAADDSIKMLLGRASPLSDFLSRVSALTTEERKLVVEQAIVLLQDFYVHLPLKRAMHAVDPLQRLRLLQRRLERPISELAFHAQMTAIFTSLRDLHTNYVLPLPFAKVVAFLPFQIEECYEGTNRVYLVSNVANGFTHPTFGRGVEVIYWNGAPIERAVEIAGERHAGSNLEARHARGIAGLTVRPMIVAPPPDEEWVVIGYRRPSGEELEFNADWVVVGLPEDEQDVTPPLRAGRPTAIEPTAVGLDLEADVIRRVQKVLFAQHVFAAKRRLKAIADAGDAVSGTDSTMPDIFNARVLRTAFGTYGYIRVRTFNVANDVPFVDEFARLLDRLPPAGLIIDVRGNGGGLIFAGERLLQLLTPNLIEPCRLQFLNTPATAELVRIHSSLQPWVPSIQRAVETGATYSAAFPVTPAERCNDIGQRYYGPVVVITNALCYSTTDIFVAGFQDHRIGKILGTDLNTGAGGANVWTLDLLRRVFESAGKPPPVRALPKSANMRVAIRRTLRVGPEAGTELEDLGVSPDEHHRMTRDDILYRNVDLINHAARMLCGAPTYGFGVKSERRGQEVIVDVAVRNIDRVDAFVDRRPSGSHDVGKAEGVRIVLRAPAKATIDLEGHLRGQIVARRRLTA